MTGPGTRAWHLEHGTTVATTGVIGVGADVGQIVAVYPWSVETLITISVQVSLLGKP